MTHHIQRWTEMDDKTFLTHAKYYRRFKHITLEDNRLNKLYLMERLKKLNYRLEPGCCGNYTIVKNDL